MGTNELGKVARITIETSEEHGTNIKMLNASDSDLKHMFRALAQTIADREGRTRKELFELWAWVEEIDEEFENEVVK